MIAHYWRDEGINKYYLRIPFWENYLLYIASYIDPEEYLKYEFYDYRRAIERGVGLCSQQAIIVSTWFDSNPQKDIPEHIAFKQFLAEALADDSAGLQDISPVGQIQGLAHVLFDQQDGHAFLFEFTDGVEDLVHQKRGQPQGRFVEHQDPGSGHPVSYTHLEPTRPELVSRMPSSA